MSLFIFRNADHHSTGQAIFVGKCPYRLEDLLKQLEKSCVPLVPPADSLVDLNLNPVRSLKQVLNGGTYLLKGKEAIDAPPTFFVPRPPLEHVRFRNLCENQLAYSCEAVARPITVESLRPTTVGSSGTGFSKGSISSAFSDGSGSRVGSPPEQQPFGSLFGPPKCRNMLKDTWQAPIHLAKELTYGGKNLYPQHKRYDLWTTCDHRLPRSMSDSAMDAAMRSQWSAASAPY